MILEVAGFSEMLVHITHIRQYGVTFQKIMCLLFAQVIFTIAMNVHNWLEIALELSKFIFVCHTGWPVF